MIQRNGMSTLTIKIQIKGNFSESPIIAWKSFMATFAVIISCEWWSKVYVYCDSYGHEMCLETSNWICTSKSFYKLWCLSAIFIDCIMIYITSFYHDLQLQSRQKATFASLRERHVTSLRFSPKENPVYLKYQVYTLKTVNLEWARACFHVTLISGSSPHWLQVLPLAKLHCFWYLVSCTLLAKGLNYISRGLKVSRSLIANMIPFVNISHFFKRKNIYIMTFRVTHWDTLDDNLAL